MRIAFLNPQGNFDPRNSYLASHPDFGGQLVYVREVARVLGKMGHHADILTRRIVDPDWPEFASDTDAYPDAPHVRILRVPCGPDHFLPKEELWPHMGEWADGVARLYREEKSWPDLWTGHYADGGLAAMLLEEASGVPFTFTGHSLGAWKLDFLLQDSEDPDDLREADATYNFGARIEAERAAMARSAVIVTNSAAERREQYEHPAYWDAVDAEDDRRFAVIPPGVDFGIFDPEAQSPHEADTLAKIRAAHERDIDPSRRSLPAVIAWSRLDPKKNHKALVEAFARHPELRDRANLIVITRGLDDPLRDPDSAPEEERPVLYGLISEVERSRGREVQPVGPRLGLQPVRTGYPCGALPLGVGDRRRLLPASRVRTLRHDRGRGDGRRPPCGRHQERRAPRDYGRGKGRSPGGPLRPRGHRDPTAPIALRPRSLAGPRRPGPRTRPGAVQLAAHCRKLSSAIRGSSARGAKGRSYLPPPRVRAAASPRRITALEELEPDG